MWLELQRILRAIKLLELASATGIAAYTLRSSSLSPLCILLVCWAPCMSLGLSRSHQGDLATATAVKPVGSFV